MSPAKTADRTREPPTRSESHPPMGRINAGLVYAGRAQLGLFKLQDVVNGGGLQISA